LFISLALSFCFNNGFVISVRLLSEIGVVGQATYLFASSLTHSNREGTANQMQCSPYEAVFELSGYFTFVADQAQPNFTYTMLSDPTAYRSSRTSHLRLAGGLVIPHSVPSIPPRHMSLVSEVDNPLHVSKSNGVSYFTQNSRVMDRPKPELTLQQMISNIEIFGELCGC
jgi:hypothetical protein